MALKFPSESKHMEPKSNGFSVAGPHLGVGVGENILSQRREGKSRANLAQRWGSDSDSCSIYSIGTISTSLGSDEDDQLTRSQTEVYNSENGIPEQSRVSGQCVTHNNMIRGTFSGSSSCMGENGTCITNSADVSEMNNTMSNGSLNAAGKSRKTFISYSAALKHGLSVKNSSHQDERSCEINVVSDDGCSQRGSIALSSTVVENINGALDILERNHEENEATLLCKQAASGIQSDASEYISEYKENKSEEECGKGKFDKPHNRLNSLKPHKDHDLDRLCLGKMENKDSLSRPRVIPDSQHNVCMNCSVDSSADTSSKAGRTEVAHRGTDGLLRLPHDSDPAVSNSTLKLMVPGQKLQGNFYKEKKEDSSKDKKQCNSEIFSFVPSIGQHNRGSVSKLNPAQNVKPHRSSNESQWQSSRHERKDKRQQHNRKHQQQKLFPPFLSQNDLLGRGFVLPLSTNPHLLFVHSQVPHLSPHLTSSTDVDSFYDVKYFPSFSSYGIGDSGAQNSWKQESWVPVLLVEPCSSVIGYTFPSPSFPLLAGGEVNVESLHAEIIQFSRDVRPTEETYSHAEAAVECIHKGVKSLWPEADVEVFGSFATGLCLSHSDVDVVVVDAPFQPPTCEWKSITAARRPTPLIKLLANAFREYNWCESLATIETASMPVIKLRCKPLTGDVKSPVNSVAIDITIQGGREHKETVIVASGRESSGHNKCEPARNTHNGATAKKYILDKLYQYPALAPLVLLLKSYLHHKGLNNVYAGGLGSYSLTLMLIFYLEQVCTSPAFDKHASSSTSFESSSASSTSDDSVRSLDEYVSNLSPEISTNCRSFAGSPDDYGFRNEGALVGPVASKEYSDRETEMKKAGYALDHLLGLLDSAGSPNLGKLLIGFLHYFGSDVDFTQVRFVLKGKNGDGGGIFWQDQSMRPAPLWIDDPLRPGINVGAGSFAMGNVQAAFREMLQTLTIPISGTPHSKRKPSTVLCQKGSLPLLDCLFDRGAVGYYK